MKNLFTAKLALLVLLGLLIPSSQQRKYFEDTLYDYDNWVNSAMKLPTHEKDSEYPEKSFSWSSGKHQFGSTEDSLGLYAPVANSRYAISKRVPQPFDNENKDLVFQYQVGTDFPQYCGGAYIKVLGTDFDQSMFSKDTPYLVMFGPDYCDGNAELKLIVRKQGSQYTTWKRYLVVPTDIQRHFYTLIWRKDGTYSVKVDGKEKASGTIAEDFDFDNDMAETSVEAKPEEWDDRPYIEVLLDSSLDKIKRMVEDINDTKP